MGPPVSCKAHDKGLGEALPIKLLREMLSSFSLRTSCLQTAPCYPLWRFSWPRPC